MRWSVRFITAMLLSDNCFLDFVTWSDHTITNFDPFHCFSDHFHCSKRPLIITKQNLKVHMPRSCELTQYLASKSETLCNPIGSGQIFFQIRDSQK